MLAVLVWRLVDSAKDDWDVLSQVSLKLSLYCYYYYSFGVGSSTGV